MVDPQPAHDARPHELHDLPVGHFEDGRVLDAQGGEAADIEEAAVVDPRSGLLPGRQLVVLAVRYRGDQRAIRQRLGESSRGWSPASLPSLPSLPSSAAALAKISADAPGVDRQAALEVVEPEAAACVIPAQSDLPLIDGLLQRHPQDGQQQPARGDAVAARPVDVEIAGERRSRPFGEDVLPPGILVALDAHVVGHDVQQLRESETRSSRLKRLKSSGVPSSGLMLQGSTTS